MYIYIHISCTILILTAAEEFSEPCTCFTDTKYVHTILMETPRTQF